MTESEVLDLLQKVGAFRAGHFVFTSGLHSDSYVNKDALYPYTHDTSKLCKVMAERFKDKDIEVVVGPTMGAAILAQLVAYHLSEMTGREVYGVYADKTDDGGFIIKRGYDKFITRKRVLVVEDVLTTGGSVRKVIEEVRKYGGTVVGLGVLCNRGGITKEHVGAPRFESLVNVILDSWEPETCELCARGIPVNTDVGHGKDFLANKANKA